MIVYNIKWKFEGPLQATDIATAKLSSTGQGVVLSVYSYNKTNEMH